MTDTRRNFSDRLLELFDDAEGVEDTIWYNSTSTLFDEIVDLREELSRTDVAERGLQRLRCRRLLRRNINHEELSDD